jgi:diacylglycerol kinase (ATP)
MIRARLESFRHAFAGVAVMLRSQPNAKIHVVATLVALIGGAALGLSALEWALLVFAIALVWVAEGLNTALEFLADAAVPDQHPLVKNAKDVAAAAVLLAAAAAVVIAMLIMLPRFAVQ